MILFTCFCYSLSSGLNSSPLSPSSGRYSMMSPGWHSSTRQIASNVEMRIAFAFPVLRIDMFACVMLTFSESSLSDIFRFAIITSMLIMIAIVSLGFL